MWTLYKKEVIDEILSNLSSGVLKFSINGYNLNFTKSSTENVLIQRISNIFLGLGFNIKSKELIWNYPHLSNVKKEILSQITSAIIEPKKNGTNLGIVKGGNEIIYRTRGSINPERFMNQINSVIISKSKTIQGINESIYSTFISKYYPIFSNGLKKGIIDEFGNFVLQLVINKINSQITAIFEKNSNVIGIFGELVSKYNPIAVDEKINYGIYIDQNEDFEFFIFDVLLIDNNKNIMFEDAAQFKNLISENEVIKIIDYEYLSNLESMLDKYKAEEGLVVKSEEGYYKFKREDVLTWERMMGKLGNIIVFATEHVFSGIGFTKSSIIFEKELLDSSIISGIKEQIWQEINVNGVSKSDLITYFAKGGEFALNSKIEEVLYKNLMLLIVPELQEAGIKKEKLYLEIPKYLFLPYAPLEWNEKRKKYISSKSYSKLISSIIGIVYLGKNKKGK